MGQEKIYRQTKQARISSAPQRCSKAARQYNLEPKDQERMNEEALLLLISYGGTHPCLANQWAQATRFECFVY